MSLADVAASTRIRSTLISAIESDDYDLCGGAVYARGHIRSIARVIGLDPEPLIDEFDREHAIERVPLNVAAQPTDPDVVARSERHTPNWTAAMVVALVVICAVALAGLLRGGGGGNSPAVVTQQQHHTTHHVTPPTSPPPSSVAQLPPEKASMLVRTLHGQTWLQVTSHNGRQLFQGLLADGQQKLFTSKHALSFIIGNAPAVDVVVNGHDIGSPPSSGSVSKGNVAPGADTVQTA